MPSVWLIGDSTVNRTEEPFHGWGWALHEYIRDEIPVYNHAQSGRSSKSFREEGWFAAVEEGMQRGDLLLIQFGHNDAKDDDRHTDPETTYTDELRAYCRTARAKKALPMLLTSVSRRMFVGKGSLLYTHGEYPRAVRVLAKRLRIPLGNLEADSRRLYLLLGEEATAELFVRLKPGESPDYPDGHDDKTHFNARGARVIAALVASEMSRDPRTAPFLRDDWQAVAHRNGIPEDFAL
ncbi:MAG: rhamnogalacturonan acetylesterase [Clostridia bacterium]|nr:rhamnogalacturonan acetylesterase [Clostridia bacterium]